MRRYELRLTSILMIISLSYRFFMQSSSETSKHRSQSKRNRNLPANGKRRRPQVVEIVDIHPILVTEEVEIGTVSFPCAYCATQPVLDALCWVLPIASNLFFFCRTE